MHDAFCRWMPLTFRYRSGEPGPPCDHTIDSAFFVSVPCPFAQFVYTGGKRGFHSTHLSRTKFDPRPMGSSVPVHLKMWAREH
jgi:hypothetical protein